MNDGTSPTGTVVWREGRWKAQLSLLDGTRPWIPLPDTLPHNPEGRARARELARKLTEEARLTAAVRSDAVGAPAGETLREWCSRWLAEREVRGLATVRTDRARLTTHVFPRIGSKRIAAITREQLEDLVTHLDRRVRAEELAWKTAINAWTLVSKMFSDACNAKDRALRVRTDNPAREVRGPDRGVRKTKVYLFPSEFLTLVRCPRLPLVTRRLYAVAIYTFARAGELEVLGWQDLDLDHASAHIHRGADRDHKRVKATKSGVARRIPLESEILPLLRAMRAEAGVVGRVFPTMPVEQDLADNLRKDLKAAGVTREELFVTDATRKNMTFHDLRATGITWAAVRGDELSKIQRRAGHTTPGTTDLYIREADAIRQGFGEVFPPLPTELLGGAEGAPPVEPGGNRSGNRSGEMENGPEPQRFRAVTLVRGGGLEPPRCYSLAPQASASANSAILATDAVYAPSLRDLSTFSFRASVLRCAFACL